jgi:hypothetical protein
MYNFAKGALALLAGATLGSLMLAGFCSIPGIAFSTVCGHNAYIWVPLFIPLGIWLCWILLGFVLVDPNAKSSQQARARVMRDARFAARPDCRLAARRHYSSALITRRLYGRTSLCTSESNSTSSR